MERTEFEKYLKERYEDQVDWYDRKAQAMKKTYGRVQMLVIVLAALTTVAAAVGTSVGSAGSISKWVTVAISALVTIFTALLNTFKYKETWLNYRGTFDALKRERSFYLAQVGDYGKAADREGLFVLRVEAIFAQESAEWQAVQRLKDQNDKPKSGNQ
jgi:hypothetical protein